VRKLAGLMTAAMLAALAPASTAMAAEAKNLQVMSWNMCGSQSPDWGCAQYGEPQDKIDVVKYHVQTNYVQAALLQEICENDLNALTSQLGSGWGQSFEPYRYSSDGVRRNNACGGARTDRIGTAIVIKAGMSDPRAYEITQSWNGQARPFHCATATYWNARLCNVHLAPKGNNPLEPAWEYADDQMADIRRIVTPFPTLVIGGDFNVSPPDKPNNARAQVWRDGPYATGYRECDQEGSVRNGRPTFGNDPAAAVKIDYVFSTETKRWCAVGDSAYSDHHVMIYSVAVD
jgi:endonuclease/exonuclease/phosphatase family metal-dependent hydrolase